MATIQMFELDDKTVVHGRMILNRNDSGDISVVRIPSLSRATLMTGKNGSGTLLIGNTLRISGNYDKLFNLLAGLLPEGMLR